MNAEIIVIEEESTAAKRVKSKLERLGYKIIFSKLNHINTTLKSIKSKQCLILADITLKNKLKELDTNLTAYNGFNIQVIYLITHFDKKFEDYVLIDQLNYITEPFEDNKIKRAVEIAISKQSLHNDIEKYRLIFENGTATVMLDENNTISLVNNAFEIISGYTREELEGKKKWDEFILLSPEIERQHNLIRNYPESSPVTCKFKFIDKYGDVKKVYSTVATIPGTKKKVVSILDTTKNENSKNTFKNRKYMQTIENRHKNTLPFGHDKITFLNPNITQISGLSKSDILKALLESEDYQKMVLSTVQTGIVVIDAETKKIIDINESALKLIGAQREDVIGHICHKFICPADKGQCPIIDHKKIIDNSERILLNACNKEIPILKTVTLLTLKGRKCLLESFMDITKLRSTENALRKSEAVLRSFFNSNNVFMGVIELIDKDIIHIFPNKRMAKFFGLNIADTTWKHLNDLGISPDLQNFLVEKLEECLKKGTINIEFNFSNENHEGWYHGSISQIKEKSCQRFSFAAIEITETKLMEDKIKTSLKEKELLLHEIHHRVKNNLQIISSLLRLQSRYINDKETLKIFQESQNRVMSLAMIHEKLYKSSNLVEINFAEYIKDLTANLFYTYKISSMDIQLIINIDNILFDIETAIPCGLIINELVTNSLKHAFPQYMRKPSNEKFNTQISTSGSSDIQIATANTSDHIKINKITVNLNEVDGNFILSIADNGIGLPNNFDFKNTASLGLQLVTSLVDQLDGSITLNKTRGTIFKITFKNVNKDCNHEKDYKLLQKPHSF